MIALLVIAMIFGLLEEARAENTSAYVSLNRSAVVIPVSRPIQGDKSFRSNFTLGSQNVEEDLFHGYIEGVLPRLLEFERKIQNSKYDDAKDIHVLRDYVGQKVREVQRLIKSSESWEQKYYQLKGEANKAVEFLTRRNGISKKAGMALKKTEWPQ